MRNVTPSPMPPKPKVLQIPMNVCNEALQDVAGIDRKTCDNMLLEMLISIVKSLGGGPVEQGRIGNELGKTQAVRMYLKDQHGVCGFLVYFSNFNHSQNRLVDKLPLQQGQGPFHHHAWRQWMLYGCSSLRWTHWQQRICEALA